MRKYTTVQPETDTHKTSDLFLATFLLYIKGRKLVKIERLNAKKSQFVFLGDCSDDLIEFYNGEGKIFLDFAEGMRNLKSMMYAQMESTGEAGGEANPENLRKGYRL